jgi:hypothetical protein
MQTDSSSDFWQSSRFVFGCLALYALLIGLLFNTEYYVGLYNDDACYLMKAFFLAQSSKISVLNEYTPALGNYLPAWPLFLAPFTFIFGNVYWPYRLLASLLSFAGACFWVGTARRRFVPRVSFLFGVVLLSSAAAAQYGHTLMAEPLFFALVGATMWLFTKKEPAPYSEALGGLLICVSLFTRMEGFAIFLAVTASLGLKKEWKRSFVLVLATLLPYFLLGLLRDKKPVHFGVVLESVLERESWLDFLMNWVQLQLSFFANALLGFDNAATSVAILVLTFVALSGAYHCWQDGPSPIPLLPPAFCLAFVLWPYLVPRYWWAVIPLWLYLVVRGTPERGRVYLLITVLLFQLGGHLTRPEKDLSAQMLLYQSPRDLPQDAQVVSLYDCRVRVQGHRRSINVGPFKSLEELMVYLSRTKSNYFLWEAQPSLIRDLSGEPPVRFPDDILLWMDRSSLFKKVESNEAGILFEFVGDRELVIQAFELYRAAFQAETPDQVLARLEECLNLVPDFPGARVVYLGENLKSRNWSKEQGLEEVRKYFSQYPHDYRAFLYLSPYLGQKTSKEMFSIVWADAQKWQSNEASAALQNWRNSN